MVESEFYRGPRCDGDKEVRLNEIPLIEKKALPPLSKRALELMTEHAKAMQVARNKRLVQFMVTPEKMECKALLRSP